MEKAQKAGAFQSLRGVVMRGNSAYLVRDDKKGKHIL